jgi:CRP-like cAMP-binding protein
VAPGPFDRNLREHLQVLVVDPELGQALAAARRDRAAPASVAAVLRREPGSWDARQDADAARAGIGLLVVEGMLVRRIGLEGRYGAELLSSGDVLQPAQHDGEEAALPLEAGWRVLTPLTLAILDLDWLVRMAPYPEIVVALVKRVMIRSRRLASMLAIAQHHRLETRLRLTFWELADRYGRVGPDGVRLDLDLTHELLSHLVGAHRPSVSAALGRLEQQGAIRRSGRGWLLLGPPPV